MKECDIGSSVQERNHQLKTPLPWKVDIKQEKYEVWGCICLGLQEFEKALFYNFYFLLKNATSFVECE